MDCKAGGGAGADSGGQQTVHLLSPSIIYHQLFSKLRGESPAQLSSADTWQENPRSTTKES